MTLSRSLASGAGGARPAAVRRDRVALRVGGVRAEDGRAIAEEAAVAMTFNRATHAVMMASPADLEDFAVGFALAEGIVSDAAEIEELEIAESGPHGIEARAWIPAGRMAALDARRRRLAGATGCGMCGLESLEEALRPPPVIAAAGVRHAASEIARAVAALRPAQALNRDTGAAHAAGWWRAGDGLVALREDVGRHNALDKLRGALARGGGVGAGTGAAEPDGILLLTSRISVELVQKAAAMGVATMVAVSAPTGLAVATAQHCGITLVGIARADGFEVFTHPARIAGGLD